MKHELLRIGSWLISTEVNGPGKRFVIWMQGCRMGCPGCLNPEFQDPCSGFDIGLDQLQEHIRRVDNLEGVTFSGGEPMLQAKTLLPLARWIKEQGLGLVSYSGYTLAELTGKGADQTTRDLIAELDILIDGPFIQKQHARLLWRGSRNQTVHFLSDRYTAAYHQLVCREGNCQAEIRLQAGQLNMTGFFPAELWQRLEAKINNRGEQQ